LSHSYFKKEGSSATDCVTDRRKKEEGRRKKVERRRKKVEGSRKKEETFVSRQSLETDI